jgi:hypothetical protein
VGAPEETSEFVGNREEGTASAQAPRSWAPHARVNVGAVAEIKSVRSFSCGRVVALLFSRSIRRPQQSGSRSSRLSLELACPVGEKKNLVDERPGKDKRDGLMTILLG